MTTLAQKLQQALERFGQHSLNCARHHSPPDDVLECNCGLQKALDLSATWEAGEPTPITQSETAQTQPPGGLLYR